MRITDYFPVHQVPVAIYPDVKNVAVVMTRNPMFAELRNNILTFYFLPEDSNTAQNGSDDSSFETDSDAREPAFSTIYVVEARKP